MPNGLPGPLSSERASRHRWLRDPVKWIAYLQVYGVASASFQLLLSPSTFAHQGALGWVAFAVAGIFYTICGVAGLALIRPYPWAKWLVICTQFPQVIQLHTQTVMYSLTNGVSLSVTWASGGWLGIEATLETAFHLYVRHNPTPTEVTTSLAVNVVPLIVLYTLNRADLTAAS